jgi:hypothetical protein
LTSLDDSFDLGSADRPSFKGSKKGVKA